MAAAKGIRKQTRFAVNQTRKEFKRAKSDLKFMQADVRDYIKNQNQTIRDRYNSTIGSTQANTAELKSTLSSQSASYKNAALAEMMRLGIQGSASGLNQMDADSANMQNVASQMGANEVANLMAMRMGSNEIGSLLKSMTKSNYQSSLNQQVASRTDNIALIRQKRDSAIQNLMMQLRARRAGGGFSGGVSGPFGDVVPPSASLLTNLAEVKGPKKTNVMTSAQYAAFLNSLSGAAPAAGLGGPRDRFQ